MFPGNLRNFHFFYCFWVEKRKKFGDLNLLSPRFCCICFLLLSCGTATGKKNELGLGIFQKVSIMQLLLYEYECSRGPLLFIFQLIISMITKKKLHHLPRCATKKHSSRVVVLNFLFIIIIYKICQMLLFRIFLFCRLLLIFAFKKQVRLRTSRTAMGGPAVGQQ